MQKKVIQLKLSILTSGLKLGFPVVITLHVIMRNTFFHLRRSVTRNNPCITFTKESLVSRN